MIHFYNVHVFKNSSPFMLAFCDGCGSQSSMENALDCRIGGPVIQRYNEIRDAL